jgi:hypothetical protein
LRPDPGDQYRGRGPGVLGIFTGAELAHDGIGTIPCVSTLTNRDNSAMAMPARPAIVEDRVRHVGDTVAMVVAETVAAARDAAERIVVNYAELPSVVDTGALEPASRRSGQRSLDRHRAVLLGSEPAMAPQSACRRCCPPSLSLASSTTGSSSARWSRVVQSANTTRRDPHLWSSTRARIRS